MTRNRLAFDIIPIAMVIFFLALLAAAWIVARKPPLPSHHIRAHVLRIAPSGFNTPRMVLVAATDDGRTARSSDTIDRFHCHVGDLIDGDQRGVAIELDPATCRAAT